MEETLGFAKRQRDRFRGKEQETEDDGRRIERKGEWNTERNGKLEEGKKKEIFIWRI